MDRIFEKNRELSEALLNHYYDSREIRSVKEFLYFFESLIRKHTERIFIQRLLFKQKVNKIRELELQKKNRVFNANYLTSLPQSPSQLTEVAKQRPSSAQPTGSHHFPKGKDQHQDRSLNSNASPKSLDQQNLQAESEANSQPQSPSPLLAFKDLHQRIFSPQYHTQTFHLLQNMSLVNSSKSNAPPQSKGAPKKTRFESSHNLLTEKYANIALVEMLESKPKLNSVSKLKQLSEKPVWKRELRPKSLNNLLDVKFDRLKKQISQSQFSQNQFSQNQF